MAKVTRFTPGQRPTRAQSELSIGLHNLDKSSSPLTSLINAPTVLCDYYHKNKDETTYSETLNYTKSHLQTDRFDKIENFVMYGRNQDEIELTPNEERRLNLRLTDDEAMILAGTITPTEGDHIVLHSQTLGIPYMITSVRPTKGIDKEVWIVKYRQTERFTLEELEARVVRSLVYLEDKQGTDSNAIVDKATADALAGTEAAMKSIQSEFVSSFYNVGYDILGFAPSFGEISSVSNPRAMSYIKSMGTFGLAMLASLQNKDKYIFNHYANDLMQQINQVLKYGYDGNTLFLTNIYGFDRKEANYKTSLYAKLLKRKFKKVEEAPAEPDDDSVTDSSSALLYYMLGIRDIINETDDCNYEPKYAYDIKFYLRTKEDHLILTNVFNSGVILVDMLNTTSFIDNGIKETYVTYRLKSPRITKFLDLYMDNKLDEMLKMHEELDDILIDKDNIDDYIGIPLLLLALQDAMNTSNKAIPKQTYR